MAINVLKPIETKYRGILFRSRIEARWAVFYDNIKQPWEYEREGYKLDASTYYLPDFWMPRQDCFIEIKGAPPTLEEEIKASVLARQSEKFVFIFYGSIPLIETYGRIPGQHNKGDNGVYTYFPYTGGGHQRLVLWSQCPECNNVDIIAPRTGYDYCRNCTADGKPVFYNSATDLLVAAYNAARSARFGT